MMQLRSARSSLNYNCHIYIYIHISFILQSRNVKLRPHAMWLAIISIRLVITAGQYYFRLTIDEIAMIIKGVFLGSIVL